MALAPALRDEWPTTSNAPQHSLHRLPASGNPSSNVRLSYAEIANGKHPCASYNHDQKLAENPNNEATSASSFSNASVSTDPQLGSPASAVNNSPTSIDPSTPAQPNSESTLPTGEVDAEVSASVHDAWQTAVENLERANVIREKIGLIVNQRYRIVQKISFGSYGSIYSAVDLHTNRDVAVKFEMGAKQSNDLHLKYENDVYHDVKNAPGVPAIYWFGSEYDHQILVMQLLGPSLEQLFNFCERRFSWETIISLGEQMVSRIRNLHSRGFLHRDIKPENFLMGLEQEEHLCFLVDFGLARRYRYRDSGSLMHIPFRKGKNLVGTAKYASINSHNGIELSRRDDLESLGYIIIEFINHELPWKEQRSKARFRTKQQSYNRIRNIKEQVDWNVVCPKMAQWICYCRNLGFSDEPDYEFLIGILRNLIPEEKNSPNESFQSERSQTIEASCSSANGGTFNRNPHEKHNGNTCQKSDCSQQQGFSIHWSSQGSKVSPRGGDCSSSQAVNSFIRPTKWSSNTSHPPPRLVRPSRQHAFNPGGGFAYPPPTAPYQLYPAGLSSGNAFHTTTHQNGYSGRERHGTQPVMGSFSRPFGNSTGLNCSVVDHTKERIFDDGTKRYSWLMRRDSSPNERYTFECLFRWTIPSGSDPAVPPGRRNSGTSFGYGGNQNHFLHPNMRNRTRAK